MYIYIFLVTPKEEMCILYILNLINLITGAAAVSDQCS